MKSGASSTPNTFTTKAALKEKEQQTAEARLLLRNMTNGTQKKGMFENHTALMGYVRQKFQERACLAISSLSKLDPCRRTKEQQSTPQDAAELRQRIWNRLTSATTTDGIRSICSIGCGPGCDATGLLKFLEHFTSWKDTTKKETLVDRIVFLDWTMDRWSYFLQPLQEILKANSFVKSVHLGFCDVLQSLSAESNAVARQLLVTSADVSDIDIFATSYLLSATRGKWHAFYRDIIQIA